MDKPNLKKTIQDLVATDKYQNASNKIALAVKDLENDGWTNVRQDIFGLYAEKAGKKFYVDYLQVGLKDHSAIVKKVYEKAPNAHQVAWDTCHKIYVLENEEEVEQAKNAHYEIVDIDSTLDFVWESSCNSRFIRFWDTSKPVII